MTTTRKEFITASAAFVVSPLFAGGNAVETRGTGPVEVLVLLK